MSHISGHVVDPPRSCGVLRINQNSEHSMYFVPPKWEIKNGDPIGFHLLKVPVTEEDAKRGFSMIAYDVVRWQNHKDAEKLFVDILKSDSTFSDDITTLEEIDFARHSQSVRNALDQITEPELKEVIEQAIAYFRTSEGRSRKEQADEAIKQSLISDGLLKNSVELIENKKKFIKEQMANGAK